jgi:hypothetical protein
LLLLCLCDTHELQADLIVPHGDLLLHCGDLTMLKTMPQRVPASLG